MSHKLITIVGMGNGISSGVANRFAQDGFKIGMIARNLDALKYYRSGFEGLRIDSYIAQADAGNEKELISAIDSIHKQSGVTSTVLLYNAAILQRANILEQNYDDIVNSFKVNVAGAIVAVRAVLPGMRTHGGSILLTGGGFSMFPNPDYGALSLGKAGIKNLTQSLATALKGTQVKVGSVTVCGYVSQNDPKYNPTSIADEFWKIHQSEPSGTDVIY
ncbi:MAG: SDR family NAD(P)-dependent oxidoreductase [Ignavibacteriaceae bacterium]|nr:SDR family NAD(P)-dependent oxidoreductase [Ignavibacteriaceae bacterium]